MRTRPHSCSPSRYRALSRGSSRGSILLYVVAAIAVLGVFSIAATGMFSSSTVGTAQVNCSAAAQYMAEAGMRYAQSQLRAQTDLATLTATASTLDSTTYTVTDGGTFDLTVSAPVDNGSTYDVTVSCSGSACTSDSPSTHAIAATIFGTNIPTPAASEDSGTDPKGDITMDPEGGNFNPVTGGDNGEGMVQTDEETGEVSFGNGQHRSYACLWYDGRKGGCTDGVCPFDSGLRVYFTAEFSYNAEADGFVFAIINADENDVNDCGGDADMGELLGYAGPGNNQTWVKGGLQPPKFGLEFDIYSNTGHGDEERSNSRNDDPASRDHAAWLLWGTHDWNGDTWDDNVHGEPKWSGSNSPVPYDANEPTNPENILGTGDGADGYYYDEEHGSNWLRGYNAGDEDKKFRIRIEVDRAQTDNEDGNYCYVLRGWIMRDEEEMPFGFANTHVDFYDPTDASTSPDVEHAVVLNESLHDQLENVIFGITVATGGASQTITIDNDSFVASFKRDETTCAAETKPDDFILAFPFDKGQGNTFDYLTSPTSRHTSSINAAYWLKGTSCPECSSLYFSDDHGPAILWGPTITNSFRTTGTVSAWVFVEEYHNYAGVLFRGSNFTTESFALQFTRNRFNRNGTDARANENDVRHGNKKPGFAFTDTNGDIYYINSDYELATETWYHLAATWDTNNDVMQFYVNGVLEETFNTNADFGWDMQPMNNPWNLPIVVGTQTTNRGTYSFHGLIDDVYLYDYVLTPEQIETLYDDGQQAPRAGD